MGHPARMDFDQWLAYGQAQGWVASPRCATHDGIVGSDEEEAEWEEGHDPCQYVLRLWPDGPRPSAHWQALGEQALARPRFLGER